MKFPFLLLNKWNKSKKIINGIFSVFGDFGVGKTTFALQTAINTARNGRYITFIYTKPNLPLEKIQIISKNSKEALNNINFIQITNFDDLHLTIFKLEFLILKYLNEDINSLNFLIIDSITNLYNLELNRDNKKANYSRNYQLNQILANLAYLNARYEIEILITNEISRKTFDNQTIEVQSGGKVMEFWVKYNLEIKKTNKLNERKLIFRSILEDQSLEFISNMRETGFED